jgi:hypothetical protein
MAKKSSMKLDALSVAELLQLRNEIQATLSGKIRMERDELQEKLDELTRMEAGDDRHTAAVRGSRKSGHGANAAGAARTKRRTGSMRAPVYIRYYDPETGKTYSSRGPMATWLREKQAAGQDIEKKYRVSKSNPLPKKLTHLTAPE